MRARLHPALSAPTDLSLLLLAAVAGLCLGPIEVGLGQLGSILWALLGDAPLSELGLESKVVLFLRTPRVLLGALSGAGLAVAGALLQGLFRNPLADPSLVGVSSGAALFASLAIVGLPALAHGPLGGLGLSLSAFTGALLATFFLLRLSRREGQIEISTLLLGGVALNALAIAGTGLASYLASEEQLRSLSVWSFGSLGGATWTSASVALPLLIVGLGLAFGLARPLDALLLGEAEAGHLGVPVERVKRRAVLAVTLLVGVSVAHSGIIGFVGLLVPHLVRLRTGPGHRRLLPASALLGGALLLGADLVARLALPPAELPLGILTALLGAPCFLWLLERRGAR